MGNMCDNKDSKLEEQIISDNLVSAKKQAQVIIENVLNKEKIEMIEVLGINDGQEYSDKTSNKLLRVLCYNLLADYYNKNFTMDDSLHENFEYRSRIIIEEIKRFNADILLLQEVDMVSEFYGEALNNLGYDMIWKMKKEKDEGPAICYKKELFTLNKTSIIDFDSNHIFEKEPGFARGQLAVVAELQDNENKKIIKIINLHTFHNPNFDHVKYNQVFSVLSYMEENFNEDDIIIWGGDFNNLPSENIIPYLKNKAEPLQNRLVFNPEFAIKYEKEIYNEMQSKLKKNFKWKNVYEYYGISLGGDFTFPEWTNYTKNFKGTLDHIIYNKNTVIPKRLLKLPRDSVVKDEKLPNDRHPSDHLPLLVDFEI